MKKITWTKKDQLALDELYRKVGFYSGMIKQYSESLEEAKIEYEKNNSRLKLILEIRGNAIVETD